MCVHDGCLAVFDEAEDWKAHVLDGGHHDLLIARGVEENEDFEDRRGEMNETEEEEGQKAKENWKNEWLRTTSESATING